MSTSTLRRPWLAAVLSLLMPGLGQLYCGAFVRCLVFIVLASGTGMLGIVSLAPRLELSGAAILVVEAVSLTLYLVGAIDAYLLAQRTRRDYEPKEYNRWYAYVLLFVAVNGGHLFSMLYARDHLVQPFRAGSNSMFPAIAAGDQVFASKRAYLTADPARGDIVTFEDPQDRTQIFVKRVVAIAGDTIEIRDGSVYLNGIALPREPAAPPNASRPGSYFNEVNHGARYEIYASGHAGTLSTVPPTLVPPHACYVLGDNRDESLDSRSFGPIPVAGITGRVTFRYAPLSRVGALAAAAH